MVIVNTILVFRNTGVRFDTVDFVIEACPVCVRFFVERRLPLERLVEVILDLVIEERRLLTPYLLRSVDNIVTRAHLLSCRRG